MRLNPVAHSPKIVIQKIGCHNLEVVVRRMGESAFAITVTHRPDAGNVRPQLIVDNNVSALIRLHSRFIQAKIVGVRPPPYGQQHMRPTHLGIARVAIHMNERALVASLE